MEKQSYESLLKSKLKRVLCETCKDDVEHSPREYLSHCARRHGWTKQKKQCAWCMKYNWMGNMDYQHLNTCARNKAEIVKRRMFLQQRLQVRPSSEEQKASSVRSSGYNQSLYAHSWTTSCVECDEKFTPPLGFLEHHHTSNLRMRCVWCRSDDHSPSRECMERISTCLPTRKPNRKSEMLKKPKPLLYIITHSELMNRKLYKIGYTRNLVNRLSVLNTATPFEFKVVQQFETLLACRLEALLHRMFASKRFRGEFFRLDDDDFVKMAECANKFIE